MNNPSRSTLRALYVLTSAMYCAVAIIGTGVLGWDSSVAVEAKSAAYVISPPPSGSITADPNPIQVCDGSGLGITTLSWQSTGTTSVQVRIGSPDGGLFSTTSPAGSGMTGKWVSQGLQVFLQDVSGGLPLTAANTLAFATLNLTTIGCSGRTGSITADPNPIQVCDGSGLGITTLSWQSTGTTSVQVRIGSPDEGLFSTTSPAGSGMTGKWVSQGLQVFLQDVSGGLPLTAANTLAFATLNLTTIGCSSHTGSITPDPNPIQVCDGSGLGITTLSWQSTGTTSVQVRIGSPDGGLFSTTGPAGSGTTGKWVGHGTQFFLQDVSGGLPLTPANTLATVTVDVTAAGCSMARLDPANRTGGGGEDPLSRNFNWSVPLVSLPGRAGLDLGLSLSYNSLVWTKSGSTISFDDDHGFPSPGFRLGFPVIQSSYFNSEVGKYAYLLITPNGERVELRQVNSSTLFESADSSHLLLDTGTMILATTEGTQLSYQAIGGEYQCTKIKDRNGNFITVNYTSFGRIDTVRDTLFREIKFNYDGNNYLTSITQNWNGQTPHTWASFGYSNPNLSIQTNFPGLTKVGPQNGSTLKVLTQVTLDGGSQHNFDYTSWGQIWKISNYAVEGQTSTLLNYRSYDLPLDASTGQTDCPRFTVRKDWAKNWNRSGSPGPSLLPSGAEQEVITTYEASVPATWTLADGETEATGKMVHVKMPDGTTSNKIYFAETKAGTPTAWHRGLPSMVETYSGSSMQRRSITTWTQDNPTASYIVNPRVLETNVYDPAGNHARARITYQTADFTDGTSFNLPQDVYEYQANGFTVLRQTHTIYNLALTYTNRHIIGLVSDKTLYEGDQGPLMSKVSFQYDEAGSIQGNDAPVQHDNPSYVIGRANLSSVSRYDVTNTSQFIASSMKYNTAGSVVETTDPLTHHVTISYADAFSDGNTSRNTLAYPTTVTVTDPDSFSSTTQYNFDFGAVTRTQGPPVGQFSGAIKHLTYDSSARIQKVAIEFNGNADYSYQRFEYSTTQNRVDIYATIEAGLGEVHSFQVFDGHGRQIASASDHKPGVYSGRLTLFDAMGRPIMTSNPTETDASGMPPQWTATGDDAIANGGSSWLYTQQTYDWKGRPRVTTNTDGTTKEASYSGCAGGEVATLTDEGTLDGEVAKRRQQKIYSDILGRTVKTELLSWQGGTPYSATVNSYNARDQVTSVKQYAGPEGSTFQDTTMTYDGYGRLKSKHVPEQNAGAATTWDYNPDDTVQKITDARGSITNFSYNSRHLVTGITYDPSSGITDTPDVSFAYDNAGNRTSMTDGLGNQTYSYDQLSRLMSETRSFNGVGSFTLSYDYNIGGQLKKITYPTNMTINYNYDTAGRLAGVTGSDTLYYGVSQYASGFVYRASGALKQMTDGSNRTSSFTYNSRLQASHYEISGNVVNQNYNYYDDGSLKFVDNITDANFDRSYFYDHAARITLAASGGAANQQPGSVPYFETFGYDTLGNTTYRNTEVWPGDEVLDVATYTNRRRDGWAYDADGRIKTIESRGYNYDASGKNVLVTGQVWGGTIYYNTSIESGYDGDGQRIKEVSNMVGGTLTTRYLRSSVLGGAIMQEINSAGQTFGYVYTPGGELLTRQAGYPAWKHLTPAGTGQYETYQSGDVHRVEFDPLGADVPVTEPPPRGHFDGDGDLGNNDSSIDARYGHLWNPAAGCVLDFVDVPCQWINTLARANGLESEFRNVRPVDTLMGPRPARGIVTDHGLGLIGVNFPNDSSGEGFTEYLFDTRSHFAHAPQTSDCAKFVDQLLNALDGNAYKSNVGRQMAKHARDVLHPLSQAGKLPFQGFKEQYIKGGQNGGAMVHIMGIAGATLLGNDLQYVVSGRTGYEIARENYLEDSRQLQEGLNLRAAGYKTLADRLDPTRSMIIGYDPQRLLDDYIDEKNAEREGDGAGSWAGHLLGQVFAGKVKRADARQQIFNRLCDK